ncbi:MAG: hypothetical protein KC636_36375 [Myxococcales bacterium]|nr:hypothetical protein [Myxococcales bacterium]
MSIIGGLGANLGFVIVPSYLAYERYSLRLRGTRGQKLEFGTSTLSLFYGCAAELPPQMRREASAH